MSPSIAVVPHLSAVACARERRLLQARPSWLHDELARQMAERLTLLRDPPRRWLDWEPTWGGAQANVAVAAVLPKALRWVAEANVETRRPRGLSAWWARASGAVAWDGQAQVDMVWANMGLRSVAQPEVVLRQWSQALIPGGLLMFSALGPHSLQAVRAIYQQHGWGEAATPFVDMHDWGDQLVAAGFADPVMDATFIDLTYSSADHLLADLREMGRNTHDERFVGCRTARWRKGLLRALEAELPRDRDGRLVIQLEVIWGQAWRSLQASAQAVTAISERDMRAMLRRNIQK